MAKRSKGPKEIVVLMVPVGGVPHEVVIEDHFRAWQVAVGGGNFTMVRVGPNVKLVCADDYHGLEHQPNGCGLYGPYFFMSVDGNGDTQSLSDQQLEKCRKYWEARRHEAPLSPSEINRSESVVWYTFGSPEHHADIKARREAEDKNEQFWHSL